MIQAGQREAQMPGPRRYLRIEGDLAFIPLTKGYEAVIDAADVPLVDGRNWSASVQHDARGGVRTVYAFHKAGNRNTGVICTMLHRAILGAMRGQFVDHIDGDGLNNRRGNLRFATKAQNGANSRVRVNNTSGFKGVSFHRETGKWRARIWIKGKCHDLRLHPTKEAAAAAFARASQDAHGEFSRHS
jgi:hypothetical protein